MEQIDQKKQMIEKIRKLIALSSSPNENEAMAAASKVQALLAQFNLSVADVRQDDTLQSHFTIDTYEKTLSVRWVRYVAVAIANLYFCEYRYNHTREVIVTRKNGYKRYDVHMFIGEEHNIAVARLMFRYIIDAGERLMREAQLPTSNKRSSFLMGFAQRIQARVFEMLRQPAKTQTENLPALYESTREKVKAFMQQQMGQPGVPARTQLKHDAAAFAKGVDAGDQVSFNKQMEGKSLHLLK